MPDDQLILTLLAMTVLMGSPHLRVRLSFSLDPVLAREMRPGVRIVCADR